MSPATALKKVKERLAREGVSPELLQNLRLNSGPSIEEKTAKETLKHSRRRRGKKPTRSGTTEKFNISVERSLAESVRAAADRHAEGNVSAWFAMVAAEGLRQEELRALVAENAAKYGPVTEAELEELRKRWPIE